MFLSLDSLGSKNIVARFFLSETKTNENRLLGFQPREILVNCLKHSYASKMVLTKQYLKYKESATFNIIASSRSNGVFVDLNETSGRYFAAAAVENILIWDLR
jgi:hypothetical protein